MRWTACLLFSIALLLTGCERVAGPASLTIEGHEFTIEIADTAEARNRGLMFREHLEPRHGMLFVYEDDARRSFWMKNTSIPLSIAFIDRDGTITEIRDLQPHSLEPLTSQDAVRYALEVNQGEFWDLGIEAGAHVELPRRLR